MRYPEKTGICEIHGCGRTPTDWHHVISRNQIEKRNLPRSMLIDRGNLKEYCRHHHMMTTSFLVRRRFERIEWERSFIEEELQFGASA
tara:strand:- start:327 stop:590 length:264 start_codon:yes stop_codon:yes gene_type:complete